MIRIASLALLLSAPFVASTVIERRQTMPEYATYTVTNLCPTAINLYIGGTLDSVLQPKANVTKTGNTGFYYTDANGGNADGSKTLRAGFFQEGGKTVPTYYYMVKDPESVNVGMSIAPVDGRPKNGYCPTPTCLDKDCTTAFDQPPTRFPAPSGPAPASPLNQCSGMHGDYQITFCPNGKFPDPPAEVGRSLHPNATINKCLDVRGAVYANGTPVQIYDCNGTGAQKWIINRYSTKVRVAGTNFCLDAGTNAANGVGMKIWQCYDNLPAQQWHYTDDNRIALETQGFCLDLTEGQTWNTNKVQTWRCTDNNNNQMWSLPINRA